MLASMARTSKFPILLVLLSLVLAACGGSGESPAETPDPSTPASSETPEESAEATESAGEAEVVPLRVAIVPGATPLPAIVAEGAGIFEANGLDVTFEIVPNLAALPGAMGRQFDIGLTTAPDIINANLQGIEVVLVSGSAYDDLAEETAAVVVSADSTVEGPADLEGLTVGAITLGGNIHPATLFWLQQNDVDVDSITFVEIPSVNQADQLAAGSIDAVQTIEPFKSIMVGAGGRVLVDPMDVVMESHDVEALSFLDFMASRSWAEENPDVLERWVASLQEAIDFIAESESEARQIYGEFSELPPEVTENVKLPNYGTTVSPAELEAWASVMKANGQLDEDYVVETDTLVVTPSSNLSDER